MSHSFSRRLLPPALFSLCIIIGFGVVSSRAQITQGSIVVSVADPSGAVLSSADLVLVDLATNETRAAATGSAGSYTFAGTAYRKLQTDDHQVRFRTQVFQSVTVSATRITDLNSILKVGAVSQAGSGQWRGRTCPRDRFQRHHGNHRHAAGRGLAPDRSGYFLLVPTRRRVRRRHVEWSALHGDRKQRRWSRGHHAAHEVCRRRQPLVQARVENMEEMTVQTDQLNMNTGYGISDMQVNFVTRRGTNTFHGRVYEDFRNAALNANTWLNDSLTRSFRKPARKIHLSETNLAAAWVARSSRTSCSSLAPLPWPSNRVGATNTNSVMSAAGSVGPVSVHGQRGNSYRQPPNGHARAVLQGRLLPNPSLRSALPTVINPAVAGIFSNINARLFCCAGSVTPNGDPNLVRCELAVSHSAYPVLPDGSARLQHAGQPALVPLL